MSSRQRKTNQARWNRIPFTDEKQRVLLLSVFPIDGLRKAREDVVDIFACVYEESDELSEQFRTTNRSEIRDWAIAPYPRIIEFDPHETVTDTFRFFGRIPRTVKRILVVLFAIASVLSLSELSIFVKNGLELTNAIIDLIPLSVLGFASFYVWFLKADTFVHRALGRELGAGKAKVMIRNESRIVGYGVWNRSIFGQTGLTLVTLFFLLRSLPHLPLLHWIVDDPAGFVKGMIEENMDIFVQSDGWLAATQRLVHRINISV